jgi:hypothetical protein
VSGGAVYTVFTVVPGSNVTANGWGKTLCLSQHPIAMPVLTAIVAVSPSIGDKPVVWCGVRVKVEPSPRRIKLTRVTASRGVCQQRCVSTEVCVDRGVCRQRCVSTEVCVDRGVCRQRRVLTDVCRQMYVAAEGCSTFRMPFDSRCAIRYSVCH